MTALSTVSLAVERKLVDAAATAPDIGISELMFWMMVRIQAENYIQHIKETDVST